MDATMPERRSNRRYDLRCPLRYRVSQKGALVRFGTGMTSDMSANGLSFQCRKPLPVGAHVEITIDWPARQANIYPMALQVTGFVVRSGAGSAGVRMTSRKFRVDPIESIRASA